MTFFVVDGFLTTFLAEEEEGFLTTFLVVEVDGFLTTFLVVDGFLTTFDFPPKYEYE